MADHQPGHDPGSLADGFQVGDRLHQVVRAAAGTPDPARLRVPGTEAGGAERVVGEVLQAPRTTGHKHHVGSRTGYADREQHSIRRRDGEDVQLSWREAAAGILVVLSHVPGHRLESGPVVLDLVNPGSCCHPGRRNRDASAARAPGADLDTEGHNRHHRGPG